MEENIVNQDIIFNNCRTGTDFENKTLDFLRLAVLTMAPLISQQA